MPGVLKAAHAHKGASLVEIIQNCIVYNDGAFDGWTDKKVVSDNSITVEHGKPLIFGADENKGIAMAEDGFGIRVITIGKDGITEDDVLVHDEQNKMLAMMLADMKQPEFQSRWACSTTTQPRPMTRRSTNSWPRSKKDAGWHRQRNAPKGRTWTVSEGA